MSRVLLLGLAVAVNALFASAETLIFYENFTKGIDFSLWKHELVSLPCYH